jgi:predicted transcriptional regulator
MAEKYFDDMNNDVQITGKRHQQRSVDGYNKLPDLFTKEDIIRCFGYEKESSVRGKIKRLIDCGMVEKLEEEENGCDMVKYRKISKICA